MNWRAIRLELASMPAFPAGSVSRAFLLRLPLHPDGSVDLDGLQRHSERAGVRRFWTNEPDRSGCLLVQDGAVGIRFEGDDGAPLDAVHPVRFDRMVAGETVTLTIDGEALPFRVVSIKQL